MRDSGQPAPWAGFTRDDFVCTAFARGARVLDVGCGEGHELRALQSAGCTVVGVDPDRDAVTRLANQGFDVRLGHAEELPVDSQHFDGLLCRLVLPYTDERRAIAEWGRVLKPGATVRASYHGAGYYLRYLLEGPGMTFRVYAARSLVNTWWYSGIKTRIPGWIGDTLYQSERRLRRYYREAGLVVEQVWASPTYLGRPVFIYHDLRRLGG